MRLLSLLLAVTLFLGTQGYTVFAQTTSGNETEAVGNKEKYNNGKGESNLTELEIMNVGAEANVEEEDAENDAEYQQDSGNSQQEIFLDGNDSSGKNEENNDSSQEKAEEEAVQKKTALKKGTKIVDKTSKAAYIVTSDDGKKPTVTWKEPMNKQSRSINIPSTIKRDGVSYKVTAIGKNAFKNNKYITNIRIASSIVKIDASAFEGCTSLKTVTIGNGLKSIGKTAFKNCKKLKTLTIKSSKLKAIGKNAFKGIFAKCKVKVPAKKVKAYTKLMKNKGQAVTVKVTK